MHWAQTAVSLLGDAKQHSGHLAFQTTLGFLSYELNGCHKRKTEPRTGKTE